MKPQIPPSSSHATVRLDVFVDLPHNVRRTIAFTCMHLHLFHLLPIPLDEVIRVPKTDLDLYNLLEITNIRNRYGLTDCRTQTEASRLIFFLALMPLTHHHHHHHLILTHCITVREASVNGLKGHKVALTITP